MSVPCAALPTALYRQYVNGSVSERNYLQHRGEFPILHRIKSPLHQQFRLVEKSDVDC